MTPEMELLAHFQEDDKAEPKSTVLCPQARVYLGRTLGFILTDSVSDRELADGDHPQLTRLLERHLNLPADTPLKVASLAMACEDFAEEAGQELAGQTQDELSKLADGLAAALCFRPSEAMALRLCLHFDACQDLRRAFGLLGEVDDLGLSRVIAHILNIDSTDALADLQRDNPFRRMSGHEVRVSHRAAGDFMRLNLSVASVLRRGIYSIEDVLSVFFQASPPPRLTLDDFRDAGPAVDLFLRYLAKVMVTGAKGVNILLYGKPGTGKTELVRAAAKAMKASLQEVPSVDEDRDPLPAWRRLTAYTAAQETMRERNGTLILFDEIEDIFPSSSEEGSFFARRPSGAGDRNKGWLTQVLERNPRPAIWVSNAINQMDPAYIRRFDMVVELNGPDRRTRERLVDQLFDGLPIKAETVEHLKGQAHFAPGHLERLAGVLRTLEPANSEEGTQALEQLSGQLLRALKAPAAAPAVTLMPYRSDCVNTDCDLAELSSALRELPTARLCLYGPPGTGKTEWARQLAGRLSKPLLVKRSSDLLSKYVGDTERLIREAFEEASREGAVLLIDEADSFLRSRDGARHGWEASMVNEMLTAMESFHGIFIASTNLVGQLDPASARRFDFKVKFSELTAGQCHLLFQDLVRALAIEPTAPEPVNWDRMRGLTPGDFANVLRQARLSASSRAPQRLVELLAKEVSFREQRPGRRIGFV